MKNFLLVVLLCSFVGCGDHPQHRDFGYGDTDFEGYDGYELLGRFEGNRTYLVHKVKVDNKWYVVIESYNSISIQPHKKD